MSGYVFHILAVAFQAVVRCDGFCKLYLLAITLFVLGVRSDGTFTDDKNNNETAVTRREGSFTDEQNKQVAHLVLAFLMFLVILKNGMYHKSDEDICLLDMSCGFLYPTT